MLSCQLFIYIESAFSLNLNIHSVLMTWLCNAMHTILFLYFNILKLFLNVLSIKLHFHFVVFWLVYSPQFIRMDIQYWIYVKQLCVVYANAGVVAGNISVNANIISVVNLVFLFGCFHSIVFVVNVFCVTYLAFM